MFCSFLLLFCVISVQAAPIVDPAKGQDQAQQNKDEGECHQRAIKQTGVDPAQIAAEASSGQVCQRHVTG